MLQANQVTRYSNTQLGATYASAGAPSASDPPKYEAAVALSVWVNNPDTIAHGVELWMTDTNGVPALIGVGDLPVAASPADATSQDLLSSIASFGVSGLQIPPGNFLGVRVTEAVVSSAPIAYIVYGLA